MASRYNTRSRRVAGSAAEPALGPRVPGAQPNLTDPNSVSGSEARLRAVIDRVVTVAEPGRVILVAGGVAAGKSALCAAVRADMAEVAGVVSVAATASATPYVDTLIGILSALDFLVDPDTDPQALLELVEHEAVQADNLPLCLVIIDDAHALPFGDLQALIGLLPGSRLCLVLTGPDSLTLLVEGLADLNQCRCTVLGLNDEPPPEPVTAQPVDRGVTRASGARAASGSRRRPQGEGGLEAWLDRFVQRMREGRGESGNSALPTIPKKHLIALASLAAVMIVGWVVARFAEEASVGVSSTARVETLAMPPQDSEASAMAEQAGDETGASTETVTLPGSDRAADASEAAPKPAQPRPIIARPSGSSVSAATAPPANRSPVADETATAPAVPPANQVDAQRPASGTSAPASRPAVAAQTAPATRPNQSEPAQSGPARPPVAAASTAATSGGRGAEWILAQPGARYTLQLVSLSSAERARGYLADQADAGAFATYRLMRNGQLFHVVVYGSFATRGEATAAAGRLPRSVGNVQPWVRTFAQIQQSVRTTPQ
jgi:hypothetical protein